MFKLFLKILKKLVIGILILFAYNTFLSSLNLMIPINIVTILFVSLFDVPGIIGLVIFLLISY